MRFRVMTISSGARTSRFLFLSRNISVGSEPGNDFILWDPALPRGGIHLGGAEANPSEASGDKAPGQRVQGFPASMALGDLTLRVRVIPWKAVALALLTPVLAIHLAILAAGGADASQDWTPIPLPAEGPFGLCRQDAAHPRGARFSLSEGADSGAVLEFAVGGGGSARTLRLTLNGRVVQDDIALSRGWGQPIQVTLSPDEPVPPGSVIEVRPSPARDPALPWGIRDLRTLPRTRSAEPGRAALEAAEAVLSDPLAEGPDLAACYLRLTRMAGQAAFGTSGSEASIVRRLEDRMGLAIRTQLRRARALGLSGREEEAGRLREGLSSWVPPGWIEGREMLGGFEF